MSTPTSNSVGVTSYARAPGDAGAIQEGVKWGGAYGSGVTLTFSFPGGNAWHVGGYAEFNSLYQLSRTEKDAVRAALAEWGAVANITFNEVGDTKSVVGDLRFGITDAVGKKAAAHAYLPGTSPKSGDVWFGAEGWHTKPSTPVKKGSYDYLVLLHEIGHAIGLKHPFENPQKISNQFDHFAYTIMSYSAAPGQSGNYANFYPTTPMYYDLVNIQGIYGRGVHNPGDTTYVYKGGKHYWETIDDSGGTDTIVYKGKDKGAIDLNIGGWSDLGKSIKFAYGSTKDTVAIGPNTVIENATGGKGRDTLIGNDVANVLTGGKGKDVLVGGGAGDTFMFTAKFSSGNLDTIRDFVSGLDMIAIRQKLVKGLDKGVVSAEAFDDHFDYDKGTLAFQGKAVAQLAGAPVVEAGDLFVV
jgi:serralysin